MPQPSTRVSRLPEKQNTERSRLDELLDATPLATVALIRDGHPVIFPVGFARIGDELVIHGSTGSPWLRQLADGAAAAVSVTALDGVLVARSGFESSFQFRSATLYGTFEPIEESDKVRYLETLTDTFIPGRVAELRASSRKELAATMALRMPITDQNWSLKIGDGWPEDGEEDVAAGAWAGVVPLTTVYGEPRRAPDCDPGTPVPPSVRAMSGELSNRRGRQAR
ncbi:pyridoxamine 5'-phosphate oxidase family protein [Mycobacterium crocinum]|uniref:Pyridoxamine 5'-phosphate oxidase family protein n=1 Tax=Mycolicibacterium crocinum TaxID=388459 RepID=A0ABY3TG42_9MYCO|nr:pyridoxamine 5'-phosphate oxidase family protein [Mycolicibacterium crocinum]MCV7218134.1 pyridoxamine 5'-phosphate oxidase family protein [Mycolicibacterium crocinum]ULN40421.1 pyridoxamine 5'-phosphate oxidase family protein [Mycolicibacterium crocinum]